MQSLESQGKLRQLANKLKFYLQPLFPLSSFPTNRLKSKKKNDMIIKITGIPFISKMKASVFGAIGFVSATNDDAKRNAVRFLLQCHDSVVFTNKRIITSHIQGATGIFCPIQSLP